MPTSKFFEDLCRIYITNIGLKNYNAWNFRGTSNFLLETIRERESRSKEYRRFL